MSQLSFGKDIEMTLIQYFSDSIKLEIMRSEVINNESIQNPKDTFSLILKSTHWDQSSFNSILNCVYYFPSKSKNKSKLKVTSSTNKSCRISDKEIIGINNINTFTLNYGQQSLSFEFVMNKIFKPIQIPLINNPKTYQEHNGVNTFLNVGLKKNKVLLHTFNSKKSLKNISKKNWPLENSKCLELNNNCNSLFISTCSECRFGFVESVKTTCPSRGNRYCSAAACGKRGEQACYRGRKYKTMDNKDPCSHDSEIAFCEKGLSITCMRDELICF